MGIVALLKKTMSNFYGSSSSCTPTTYDDLVARVQSLESLNDGLSYLKGNEVSFGDILAKLDQLCAIQNQQTTILADLQSRLNSLETNGSPSIISVTTTTSI